MTEPNFTSVKPNKTGRRYMTTHEARSTIAATLKRGHEGLRHRDHTLLQFLFRHAARVSEACALTWHDVDLNRGTVTIQRAKGGKPTTHGMNTDEVESFRKLREGSVDGLHVFEARHGGPISVDAVQRLAKIAGEAAGVKGPSNPHAFRHAAGFQLANEKKQDIRVIQDYLGHQAITSTARYTELAPGRLTAVRVK